MLSDRQKLILKAIIEEYIESNDPVGSKVLTEKPYLNFSSATIRYDMQFLEENGYLEKTHTSSGRIPAEKGYRYYVEHLITRDSDILESYKELDQIFDDKFLTREEATIKMVDKLSNMISYMTVINGSSANYAKVKKMEIVPLDGNETLLLVVTSNGQVQSQKISIPEYFRVEDLLKIIDMFDNAMYDRPVYEIRDVLSKEAAKPRVRKIVDFHDDILNFLIKCFTRFQNGDYYSSGLSKIFNHPEFQDFKSMQKVISVLDDGIILDILNESFDGLMVRIGSDNNNENLKQCSIVSVPYIVNDDAYGSIAVVGPIRMQYKIVIPLLEYIAKSMTKLYNR